MPKEPLFDEARGLLAAEMEQQGGAALTGTASSSPAIALPKVDQKVIRTGRKLFAFGQRRGAPGELSPLPQIRPAQQPTAAGDPLQTGINRVPTAEKARQQSAIVLVTTSGNVPALHHKTPRG